MSNGGVRFAVKLSAYSCFAACFVGSLIYDELVVPPGNLALRFSDYGGKWKYLTHLNMVSTLQVTRYTTCILTYLLQCLLDRLLSYIRLGHIMLVVLVDYYCIDYCKEHCASIC